MRRGAFLFAVAGLLGAASCDGRALSEAAVGEAPLQAAQAPSVPASDAALEFVRRVIAGDDFSDLLRDFRGQFLGESIGFSGPYEPAPDIAERVREEARPLVGLRARLSNAPVLRVLENGMLVEAPNRTGPISPGAGCDLVGDIHIGCSVVLHTGGGTGEVVVWMISRRAFRDLPGDHPDWLVDGVLITVPVLPFTG